MLPGFTAKTRDVDSRKRPPVVGRASTPPWISDDSSAMLVGAIVWLQALRMIIPGFFDYSQRDSTVNATGPIEFIANQIIWLTLLLAPVILLRARWELTLRLLGSLNRMFVVLLIYTFASILWSAEPVATFRKFYHLEVVVGVCMAACLISWHPRRFQNIIRPIVTILLVGSVIFSILRPDLATTEPNYLAGERDAHWRGLTVHKNALGSLASFGLLYWFHGWLFKELKLWPALLGIAVAGVCLVMSGSSTSVLAAAFTVGFLLMTQAVPQSLRRYMPFMVGLFVVVIVSYGLAILNVVPGMDVLVTSITSVTNKTSTFTGRTPIWEIVKAHIALHPIFGTGYGGYWTVPPGPASAIVLRKLHFYPTEAHNGYLDIINDLGYVGLGLLLAFCANYVIVSLRLMKIDRSQGALYLGMLFYLLLQNLSESTWLDDGYTFMQIIFATVAMSRALLDVKLKAQFGNPSAQTVSQRPPGSLNPQTR
jgi:exopolysaccharide production protein ExoQ